MYAMKRHQMRMLGFGSPAVSCVGSSSALLPVYLDGLGFWNVVVFVILAGIEFGEWG